MIPKIYSVEMVPLTQRTPFPRTVGDTGNRFQTLLEGALGAERPLEARLLSLLVEIIEKMIPGPEVEPLPLPFRAGSAATEGPSLPKPSESLPLPDLDIPPEILFNQKRQNIDRMIREAAGKHDVDADLIRAVIQVESHFDPRAVSPAGAQGLMQLMPGTAADLGVRDPFDPGQNIDGGTRYLRKLLDRYGGNRRLALAAYNWGMGNLEKRPESMPQETRRYIAQVEKNYRQYSALA